MGNLPSAQVEGEDMFDDELEKASQKQGVNDIDKETNLYDFSVLFNTEGLLKALVDIKDVDNSELNKKKSELEQWLKNLSKRGETAVSDVEFVDFASNKGISKEEALKFFTELDPDQQGSAEVSFVLQMLKDRQGPSMSDMMIIPCPLLPGSLDTYIVAKPGLSSTTSSSRYLDLGTEIIKFLRKYRVDPTHLPPYTISQLAGLFRSREQMIKGRYQLVKEKQTEGLEETAEDDEYRVTVRKCYSGIFTSTNEKTCSNLTDCNLDTYWQSNGSPRSHWIRLHMLPGVYLKELAVAINSTDDSYMPKVIAMSVGNSPSNLRELRSHTIPREYNGRFLLMGPLSKEYSYIQINIRQCHSDGCDTRIRQLYIKGYKHTKETDQPTVLDGLVMWYLGLISSVSKAAMPIMPSLRDSLLTQSKTALQYLPPLSLSKSSPYRPEFLTPVVLAEMETFIKSLCLPGDNVVSLDSESLSILTGFCLATGNLNTILECQLHLLDNISLELPVSSLVKKLFTIEQKKHSAHAPPLSLAFVKSDCKAEGGYAIDNIFTNEALGSGTPFKSVKDVKVVNIIVKEEKHLFKLVKINIKVPSSDIGARAVLVFGFLEDAADDIESEDFLKKFEEYDSWTLEEWKTLKRNEDNEEPQLRENGLITYLEPSKDSKEFEVELSSCKPLKYLLFKFLGQESAERVAVHSLSLKGYKMTPQMIDTHNILEEADDLCPSTSPLLHYEGGQVMVKLLVFLCRMLQDLNLVQSRRTAAMLDPDNLGESHICVEKFSLETIWNLYIPLTLRSDESLLNSCSLLCLILLRRGVQFLKATPTMENKQPLLLPEDVSQTDDSSSVASAVLSHLCSLMDSTDTKPIIQSLARDIIREGVVVFFPGTKARKQYLLDMVSVILTGEQPPSWWLKFEALCSYFSQKDNNSLLELNWDVNKIDDIVPENVLNIFSTFLTVATKQVLADLESKTSSSRPDDLVKLLCALQSSLFYWCKHLLSSSSGGKDNEKDPKILTGVKKVLSDYVGKVYDNCNTVLVTVNKEEDPESALTLLERSVVGQTLPQLVAFLGTLFSENLPFVSLLHTLNPLSTILSNICNRVPSIAPRLGSDELICQGDNVVSVWTRESKHNYEDNLRITEDFVCPTASRFVVEFDSRCHTERRYDYLTFTDSVGTKLQHDDNYGSDRWPTKGEFKGPKLTFYFYSDGSNNYWGYKFTVKAYGKSIPPLHWIYDLHISLARLFGQFVSSLISAQTVAARTVKTDKEEDKKEEEALLKSDLWTTLFRGGYLGKFTRSLSEAHATIPTGSSLSSMLFEMAEGGEPSSLIETCRSAKSLPSYGGPLVDKAIGTVFAALIWHSQEIREELISNTMGSSYKPTPNVIDAFSAAEALRRELVEARQKIVEAKEKEEDEEAKSKMDEDEPLVSCHSKAMFLLKFAGLTRISYDSTRPSSPVTTRPSWGQKLGRFQRTVSTVERIKQQISRESKPQTLAEKHPSFETVLSFVRNTGLTIAKVESLLQERAELAGNISKGYSFAAEYLTVMTAQSPPEMPLLSFLQHLLVHQRKFPRHYAIRVDGCGLELETELRRSFQTFIQILMGVIRSNQRSPRQSTETNPQQEEEEERVGVVRNVFTHLLDMCWQDYDFQLLRDLQLPDYLFETVISSSVTENSEVVDKFEDEDRMLKKYELHMRFMEKWNEVSRFTQFLNSDIAQEDFREANLFVVAMASNSARSNRTRVNCDGCSSRIDGPWYRDIDVDEDCDLCSQCFSAGTGSRPPSFSKEHVLLHVGHHLCEGCGMSIVSHRFQRKADKCNYCMGCFRKESSTDIQWTVFLLTEQPATENSNKFKSSSEEYSRGLDYCNGILTKLREVSDRVLYNRQHCWLLFSSLTLTMAQRLSQKDKSASDPQYQHSACELLLICLQLVVQGLKFSLSAAKDIHALKLKEMEDKKRKEAEKEREKEKDKKEQEVEEEPIDRIQFDKEKKEEVDAPEKAEEVDALEKKEGEETPQSEGETIKLSSLTKDTSVSQPVPEAPPTPELQEGGVQPTPELQDGGAKPTPELQEGGAKPTPELQEGGVQPTPELQGGGTSSPTPDTLNESTDSAVTDEGARRPSALHKQQTLSETTHPSDGGVTSSEKAFGLMFCDSMLGLLACVLPTELSLNPWISVSGKVEHVVGDTILPQLFRLAKSEEMTSANRLQAILVAIKYMSRVSPEVADHAVEVLEGVADVEAPERKKTNGQKTVDYLFEMGTTHLKQSNISGAASMSECLLLLSKNLEWKPTITQKITDTLSHIGDTTPDLSMVFGLLVLAGFPKLAKVGSSVKWSKGATDEENYGVIVTPVTDSQANIINIKTRQSHSLKLSDIQVENPLQGCITENKLPELISLIKRGIPQANKESPNQVEYRWILSLALKSLNVLLRSSVKKQSIIETLLAENLLPSIVKLACKPTHFSKQWILSDLEILGISSYKTVEEIKKKAKEQQEEKEKKEKEEKEKEEKEKEEKEKEEKEKVKKEKVEEEKEKEEKEEKVEEEKEKVEKEEKVEEEKEKEKVEKEKEEKEEKQQETVKEETSKKAEEKGEKEEELKEAVDANKEEEMKETVQETTEEEADDKKEKKDVQGEVKESGEDKVDGAQSREEERERKDQVGEKEDEERWSLSVEAESGPVDELEPEGVLDEQVEDVKKKEKSDQTKTTAGGGPEGKKRGVVIIKSPPPVDSSPGKSKAELEEEAALRGLPDDIREMLKIMKDAFQCNLAAVRAMYEAAEEDMDKFIMSSDKYYDSKSSGLKLPEEILEASKKWMPFQRSSSFRDSSSLEDYQEDQEDAGVMGFMAVPIDLKKIGAKPESESELKKSLELLPNSKDSKKKIKEMDEREKSHSLLQEQLKELATAQPDRELMLKVNRALVILHSREILTSLLLYWPQDVPKISSTLLGRLEISHWFSLLDFLVKRLTQEERNKVLGKVVSCSEPTELVTLGLTAAQCMKEVVVDLETKEFKYQSQEEETMYTGKIVMANAVCVKVTMEKSHSLCGSIEFAADEEFTKHHWAGTGSGGKKKEEQEWNIPGNVVHYKVTLNKMENQEQKKAWSFKVSGLQKGRFETSYSLLHILLGSPTTAPTYETPPTVLLPIVKLWPSLIAAACELTGEQRIKLIGILLQLLLWNSSAQKVEEGGASAVSGSGSSQKLDLTMLKPLWSLYTTMSKDYDKGDKVYRLKPEILRALTELFLVVENTALDWRVEQDLLVETITEENLRQLLEKGISNVAYASLGLGLTNQVSEAFIEAKKNYVPPSPPVKDPPTHHSSSSSSSSSSSDDDDDSSNGSSTSSDSFEESDNDYY